MNALELLKLRLGISTDKRDAYLNVIIDSIKEELINQQKINLDESNSTHLMFLVDYAEYRYSNKGESSGMPRHLQWRLHNLVVSSNEI